MQFVDTNIFIRFLTKDDVKKAEACLRLFKEAEKGKIELQTTEAILAEVVYILESERLYNLSKSEIYLKLSPILNSKGLKIPRKRTMTLALSIFSKCNVDFEDSILAAHALQVESKEICSYDKGFERISGIKRLEP